MKTMNKCTLNMYNLFLDGYGTLICFWTDMELCQRKELPITVYLVVESAWLKCRL